MGFLPLTYYNVLIVGGRTLILRFVSSTEVVNLLQPKDNFRKKQRDQKLSAVSIRDEIKKCPYVLHKFLLKV